MPNQSMTLSQEQSLRMVLAPQLRQSLEMLQAPMLELRAMIRAELDQNPTLEETSTTAVPIEVEPPVSEVEDENKRLDFRKEFEILARLDDEWREYFFQEEGAKPYTTEDAERRKYFFDSIVQTTSLQEHLMNQLALAELQEADRKVGEMLVGSINDDGYLVGSLDELAVNSSVDLEHIQSVLSVIQEFDPPGVGGRDLSECLLLQLERLGRSDSLAAQIVQTALEKLGARKYQEIARALKVSVEQVQEAAAFIATLDPKPGRIYSGETSPYVTPEIVVTKVGDEYVVLLNDDDLPRVRISKQYRTLMQDANTTEDVRKYIQEKVRSGAFLIKSIHQRQHTIFRIATEIVRVQQEFFEKGIGHLKPLIMADVAAAVGLHETTISRAVAGKHMQTPRGVFEMKFFFTPGLKTQDGSVLSNKTVQDIIASLIAEEDTLQPRSDQDILEILKQRGIHIARRTVAKYRIALRIPPSHLRRSY